MVLWSVLWIATNAALAALFPDIIVPEQYVGHLGILLTFLTANVTYSVAAGYLTGMIAARHHVKHGLALGIVQVAVGITMQTMFWDLRPRLVSPDLPGTLDSWKRGRRGDPGRAYINNPS